MKDKRTTQVAKIEGIAKTEGRTLRLTSKTLPFSVISFYFFTCTNEAERSSHELAKFNWMAQLGLEVAITQIREK